MACKVFINNPNDDWYCSRIYKEWHKDNSDISTLDAFESDVIWLMAPWKWRDIPEYILFRKYVVCTIHHLAMHKFKDGKLKTFMERDRFVNAYHVPCIHTLNQVKQFTSKPIHVIPYWVNNNIWYNIDDKVNLRKEFKIDPETYLIGSFQRDTEGNSIADGSFMPKLEKGPDLFCDEVERIHKERKDVKVLLAGWRRQYVMARLDKAGIPYYYIEMPDIDTINKLYNCLDLYIVASRYEGGPQSIAECASNKTPIISTDVGWVTEILDNKSIFEAGTDHKAVPDIESALANVEKLWIPNGFEEYRNFFIGEKYT